MMGEITVQEEEAQRHDGGLDALFSPTDQALLFKLTTEQAILSYHAEVHKANVQRKQNEAAKQQQAQQQHGVAKAAAHHSRSTPKVASSSSPSISRKGSVHASIANGSNSSKAHSHKQGDEPLPRPRTQEEIHAAVVASARTSMRKFLTGIVLARGGHIQSSDGSGKQPTSGERGNDTRQSRDDAENGISSEEIAAALTHPTPFHHLAQTQGRWQRRIEARLLLIMSEYNLTPSAPTKMALSRENYVDLIRPEPVPAAMYVFDSLDLLEEIQHLQHPNMSRTHLLAISTSRPGPAFFFKPPSLDDLQKCFSDLTPTQLHMGTHDCFHIVNPQIDREMEAREREGSALTRLKSQIASTAFCKRGCPLASRPYIWHHALCGGVKNDHHLQYEELWSSVRTERKAIDHLLAADVFRVTAMDDSVFLFRDSILEALIAFMRDPRNKLPTHKTVLPPSINPSGVMPFRSLSYLVSPLTFLYRSPSLLYAVFQKMYHRYFYLLHTISAHPNGIVRLSEAFLSLMNEQLPEVVLHMQDVGVSPLSIAFPWLFQAFSGFLKTSELLLLWDRIIGFDSLYLLPLLAFAIFSFRQKPLLKVRTKKDMQLILADFRTIAPIPLLQYALFATNLL